MKKVLIILILGLLPSWLLSQDTLTLNDYLLGDLSLPMLEAAFIFAFMGMAINWIRTTLRGIKYSKRSGNKHFGIGLWLRDNALTKPLSITLTLLVLFAYFRFSMELLNRPLTMALALIIGLSIDVLVDKLQNVTLDTIIAKKSGIVKSKANIK